VRELLGDLVGVIAFLVVLYLMFLLWQAAPEWYRCGIHCGS
jgi:hypothetical protein